MMGEAHAGVARPSLNWPSATEWSEAKRLFDAAFLAFEVGLGEHEKLAADGGEDEIASDFDQMAIWRRVGRGGAPSFVRGNAWLLLAWGLWCVKKEEPALVWIGWAAGILMVITAAYPAVRWVVALLLGAGRA